MPYITSQFMPRTGTDCPRVVPEGCTNLAFMGQFVEIPGDVVFTIETSVRTPLQAVYQLTGLEKELLQKINSIPPYYVMYQGKNQSIAHKKSVLNPEFPKIK